MASLDMFPQDVIDEIIAESDRQKIATEMLDEQSTQVHSCMDRGLCPEPMDCGSWNSCSRNTPMPVSVPAPRPHERIALALLSILHDAEEAMIGKRVTTAHGYEGVIRGLHLDSVHGLSYTLDPPSPRGVESYYPVSTIKDIEL